MKPPALKPEMIAAAALSLLGPPGCAATAPQSVSPGARAVQHTAVATDGVQIPPGLTPVPGIRKPNDGLYAAGQPAPGQWRDIAAAGVTTVINLRPQAELEGRDEQAEVDAAGMRYVHLPVAGPGDITAANADALARALGGADGPVLVHCASGNRVGALLALAAARAGVPVDEAIAYGRSAGLGSAEAVVRQRLQAPAAED